MTTIPHRHRRALAMAAFLVLAAPACVAAEDSPAPAEDTSATAANLAQAQALYDAGRYGEALTMLRTLTEGPVVDADAVFLHGLTAIEASRWLPADAVAEKKALLDEAIAALHSMLVQRPDLVRVRLELARAFFYKREDSLARDHFERVLAGDPPPAVVANVRRFIAEIRARRRWTTYLGLSLAPDTNIGAASDEEFIYIFDLPFRRDNADDLTTSGVGASVWTGGEYQHPLGNRLRLRAGVDLAFKEYAGREFDETNLAVHLGPRVMLGPRTEASVLASARRRWQAGSVEHDAAGVRVQVRRRLAPRVSANVRASWHKRDYRGSTSLDGPMADLTLGGTWTISSTLRANAAVGYAHERPELENRRNDSRLVRAGLSAALPRGFTVGGRAQFRWTDFDGAWPPFTPAGEHREDRTDTLSLSLHKRDFTLFGFSPQVVVTHEERRTNAQAHDYDRTRAELRFVRQF